MDKRNKRKENLFIKFIRIILLIILSPFVVCFLIKTKINNQKQAKINAERIRIYNISQINTLSGMEFEKYLKILFEKIGYSVDLTKKSKDFGVDLILKKRGKQAIVQAKRYAHTVGIAAVQEIISARAHYGVYDAIVITNQSFSKEAQILAAENNVMLAGGDDLCLLAEKYPIYFEKETTKVVATKPESQSEIEKKYPYWI